MTLMTLTTGWKIPALAAAAATVGVMAFSPRAPLAGRAPFRAPALLQAPGAAGLASLGESAADGLDSAASNGFIAGKAAEAPAPAALRGVAMKGLAREAAPRKMVRTGSLTLEVPDTAKARSQARAAAAKLGAEIEDDSAYGSEGTRQATLSFKVDPDRLEALVDALQTLGRVTVRSLNAQNMGEEYVDLRSRLANLRRVEGRLHELLSFKTNRLVDVLQVERELERVGGEIERIEGRMKYIDALAASSRLTVTLCEPALEQAHHGVLWDVRNALVGALNTFLGTGLALLRLTCWLAAVALWVAPVSLVAWAVARRFQRP